MILIVIKFIQRISSRDSIFLFEKKYNCNFEYTT